MATLQPDVQLYNDLAIPGSPAGNRYGAFTYGVVYSGPDIDASRLYGSAVRFVPAIGTTAPVRTHNVGLITGDATDSDYLAGFVVRTKNEQNSVGGASKIITAGDSVTIMTSGDMIVNSTNFPPLAKDNLGATDLDIYLSTATGTNGMITYESSGNIDVSRYITPWSLTSFQATDEGVPFKISFDFRVRIDLPPQP
jgi:hypothetical protein